jgi:hypothetical protein
MAELKVDLMARKMVSKTEMKRVVKKGARKDKLKDS